MKTFRAKTGPFAERPFYEAAEIESICAEELQKLKLYPSDPAPIRIDRFIEKRFGIQPTYEDLPKGLLGFTRFGAKGVAEIVVAKVLDEEGTVTAERRLRSTWRTRLATGCFTRISSRLAPVPIRSSVMGSHPTPRRYSAATGASPDLTPQRRSLRTAGGNSRQTKRWGHSFCRRRWWRRPCHPCWYSWGFSAFRPFPTTAGSLQSALSLRRST